MNDIILNTIQNDENYQPSIVEVQDNLWENGYEMNGQVLVNVLTQLGYGIHSDNTVTLFRR